MSFGRDAIALTTEEQAVLDLIKNHKALIKVIPDSYLTKSHDRIMDYSSMDYYLKQLADLNFRPSRSEYFFSQLGRQVPATVKKINLKTQEIHDHEPGKSRFKRGGDSFTHTLKTATTLLPPEPQYMTVFNEDWIGFLWDIDTCDLKKEKYVFPENALTDMCFWYNYAWISQHPTLSSIPEIRATNEVAVKEKTTIAHNEILACLPPGRPRAIFSPRNYDVLARLRAWDVMLHAKGYFKLDADFPVLSIQAQRGERPGVCKIYTAAERKADYEYAYRKPPPNMGRLLAKTGLFSQTPSIPEIHPLSPWQDSIVQNFVGF